MPFWTHRVRGEGVPSSLTFIDDGIVIGWKNGTIFQLLSVISKNVLSTLKFVNGTKEDLDMFGHVNYDSRIQTLWVANGRGDSLIAAKIGFDVPLLLLVTLFEVDPTGEEAHAACIATKVPPSELALVAFSVHSTRVDQVLVSMEWYDNVLNNAISKFLSYAHPQVPAPAPVDIKPTRHARLRTPPSEELDSEMARDDVRAAEAKGKNAKGKNVAFRDRNEREKNKIDTGSSSDSGVVQLVAKEIKKSEESLHNHIGRLIGKEMDKQNARFEEARAHEQAEDFNQQEKILKLISTELTGNTTRVVEMAVKAEVQNSVLPALEHIARTEVRAALNEHVGRSLMEYIQNNLPVEMEKLLLRPDISTHFASILSNDLNPLIERYVKESVSKTFLPAYSQQTSATEAARSQEALIRELKHSVRVLSDQVKFLMMNATNLSTVPHRVASGGSPVPLVASMSSIATQPLHRQQLPTTQSTTYTTPPSYSQATQLASMHGLWYTSTNIAASQASHPIALPPPPAPASQRSPPTQPKPEEWDDRYLSVLSTQDSKQLHELLARSSPEVIMPLNGPEPLSQAVILTLFHRLAATWLQRVAAMLNINEPLVSPYVARVDPNVKTMLNTTKQRLSILPGSPQLMDSVRTISDIQDTLTHKQI
ncbi:hypothetical protein EDD17DRAFT_1869657 [Pisolithus thermaeus]|nr:hypothetical protein EV401DRAFT_2064381 [Pisolithus croceorrhizus]KAI6168251.1 hypothetical protein EDD17DRAFT_1869657 [Pisolithus thermaeus]